MGCRPGVDPAAGDSRDWMSGRAQRIGDLVHGQAGVEGHEEPGDARDDGRRERGATRVGRPHGRIEDLAAAGSGERDPRPVRRPAVQGVVLVRAGDGEDAGIAARIERGGVSAVPGGTDDEHSVVNGVLDGAELAGIEAVAREADIDDPGTVVDGPADARGDRRSKGPRVPCCDAHGHDRAFPAIAGHAHPVVAGGSDHARDPRPVAEVVVRIGVVAEDVPAREHLGQVGERRQSGVDDGDHDRRVAGGQLPEIRGAGQPGPPFVAPDRIVRLGDVARACRRRSERRQSPEQAEESHYKGAPHVRQCTDALQASIDQRSALRRPVRQRGLQTRRSRAPEWAPARVFPWKPYPFATLSPGAGEFIKVDALALISVAGALKTKGGGLKEL